MRAYCLIREKPWYRREAFIAGLKAAGMEVLLRQPDRPGPDCVLVIWNRYAGNHDLALRVEAAGGRVWVCENGYLGRGGVSPKFDVHPGGPKPESYYAIAEGWHNGRGRWPVGGPERFAALGVTLQPWRPSECRVMNDEGGPASAGDHPSSLIPHPSAHDDRHVLVCPNRSFGVGEQMMHPDWAERCAEGLKQRTRRPVRIRRHPGNDAPKRPLAEDLKGAWAVAIWSSGAGVHALIEGIPVFCAAPYWILKGAAASGPIEAPVTPERLSHFERLAWAQWSCEEIAAGVPFRRLLQSEG